MRMYEVVKKVAVGGILGFCSRSGNRLQPDGGPNTGGTHAFSHGGSSCSAAGYFHSDPSDPSTCANRDTYMYDDLEVLFGVWL